MLAGRMLELPARRTPHRVALTAGDRRMTFRELSDAANQFANALHSSGVAKGERIAAMLPNVAEYAAVHFGAARAGAILAHLSFRYAPKDLVYVLNKIGATSLVFDAEYAALVAEIAPQIGSLRRIVVVDGPADALPEATAYDDFVAGQPTAEPTVELSDSDPYAITFTGGTTGFPKAVLVSHKCRTASAVTIVAQHGLSDAERAAVVTPIFHAVGLFVWFQPLLWLGCSCSLLRTWNPERFMDLVERDKITAAFLVPTQLNGLVRHPRFEPSRLATLRHIGFAGSPMPSALIAELRALFPNILFTENYGQSETGPMTVKRHWEHTDKPDSIGRPSFNVELDIFGPDGRPVAAGEVGEIVTRGDHLMVAYDDDPEQTAALFKSGDGWLWTGDLGFRDAEGYFALVDRSKDMVISGGENIYPKEIEDALYKHPAVAECAVFGIPDDHWGEVPAAHVVLRDGNSISAEDLIDFSLRTLARYKRPRLIEFVAAIPKTPVGKMQKHLIRAPYWKGRDKFL
ncbi:MAG: AMP-binding protein [Alphaproteobacteria bacterium]|nr:AMP-binding protein [Alphaproteobacteria bacterium]